MSIYALTHSIPQKLVFFVFPRNNLWVLWIFGFLLVISLLVFYVFQVNSLTGEIYLLKEQERKLTEIKRETEILEINLSRFNSLANIENYFQNHNFIKANQVKYIQISDISIVELPTVNQTK